MESKDWSGFGYFSPDLEKIKQLVVCSKHQNTWEDTGNVVKVFFSIQSKKKNVRQWKETEFSTPFVVKAATSLLLNSLKFTWKALTFFVAKLVDFKTLKRRTMNPETGVWVHRQTMPAGLMSRSSADEIWQFWNFKRMQKSRQNSSWHSLSFDLVKRILVLSASANSPDRHLRINF